MVFSNILNNAYTTANNSYVTSSNTNTTTNAFTESIVSGNVFGGTSLTGNIISSQPYRGNILATNILTGNIISSGGSYSGKISSRGSYSGNISGNNWQYDQLASSALNWKEQKGKEKEKEEENKMNLAGDNTMGTIILNSNIILLIGFVVVYLMTYFLFGMLFGLNNISVSQIFDLVMFVTLIMYLWYSYSTYINNKEKIIPQLWTRIKTEYSIDTIIFSAVLFIIAFYFVIYMLNIPMTLENKPLIISIIDNGIWLFIISDAIVLFMKYVLGVNIIDYIDKLFFDVQPQVILGQPTPVVAKEEPKKEVFNIANNDYTYSDAQTICASYGATLATYDQIESAYNDGAEWCDYGWSDGQMAYFPTQKETWQKLQQNEETKNTCGRPGINGGYMADKTLRFGVNCYGIKPPKGPNDIMQTPTQTHTSPTTTDSKLNDKVQYWKENSSKIFKINSFNKNKWSEY